MRSPRGWVRQHCFFFLGNHLYIIDLSEPERDGYHGFLEAVGGGQQFCLGPGHAGAARRHGHLPDRAAEVPAVAQPRLRDPHGLLEARQARGRHLAVPVAHDGTVGDDRHGQHRRRRDGHGLRRPGRARLDVDQRGVRPLDEVRRVGPGRQVPRDGQRRGAGRRAEGRRPIPSPPRSRAATASRPG